MGVGALAGAQLGMFAIDTAAGSTMVKSIGQMQVDLTTQLERIHELKKEAKLGDLPEAQAIAARDRQVAAEDHGGKQSLEFVLQHFADSLREAEQILHRGMSNYAEVEAHEKQAYQSQIGHG